VSRLKAGLVGQVRSATDVIRAFIFLAGFLFRSVIDCRGEPGHDTAI
jgi:hypothetical protein